jgi:hypothetical protein
MRRLTFGNSGRNSLGGRRNTKFDMGIFKDFPIFERFTAQVPAEAFNVFNYRQFTGVNNSHGCFLPNGNNASNAGSNVCVNGNTGACILFFRISSSECRSRSSDLTVRGKDSLLVQ